MFEFGNEKGGVIIKTIITDVQRIAKLAQEREDENWRFRSYLKGSGLSSDRIDAAVRDLYREISAQIDCRKCANCCIACSPILIRADQQRLAKHLKMNSADFQEKFLAHDEENEGHVFRQMPCPFLQGKLCSVYDQRPRDCRAYPHLHKRDFVFRLTQAVSNYSICPIVFNLYEELKAQFWTRRSRPRWN